MASLGSHLEEARWLILMGAHSCEMYFTHFVVLAALERCPIKGWVESSSGGTLLRNGGRTFGPVRLRGASGRVETRGHA